MVCGHTERRSTAAHLGRPWFLGVAVGGDGAPVADVAAVDVEVPAGLVRGAEPDEGAATGVCAAPDPASTVLAPWPQPASTTAKKIPINTLRLMRGEDSQVTPLMQTQRHSDTATRGCWRRSEPYPQYGASGREQRACHHDPRPWSRARGEARRPAGRAADRPARTRPPAPSSSLRLAATQHPPGPTHTPKTSLACHSARQPALVATACDEHQRMLSPP